jgi:hypothetical protein
MIALAAVLLAAPATHANASPAGLYQVQQMEVGGGLELRKNGHFRYALAYGAVDEEAEGDWTFDGKIVRLTTKPAPKPPSFELVRDDPAPRGQLLMTLEPPGFGEGYRLDAVGTDAQSGEKGRVSAADDGTVDSGGHSLSAVDPLVPVYGSIGGHFPLSPDRGHHLVLRFHANDLGHAAFDREPLAVTPRGLVFDRYDTEIRFVRVRP